MSSVTVQSRIDTDLKQQVDVILSNMGMSTADAIRIFLHQVVTQGGLPFQPYAKIPNAQTLETFAKTDAGEELTAYDTVDDFFKALGQK